MKTRNRWKAQLPIEASETLQTLHSAKSKELNSYIVELRNKGWSLGAISIPLGMSRERIRQLSTDNVANVATGYSVPDKPTKPVKERVERVIVEPNREVVSRLLELQPMAQAVRGKSQKYRTQGEEYTRLVAQELARGVTPSHLAKELGVTHSALNFRLVRYGYAETSSTAKCYSPIAYGNTNTNTN